MSESQKPQIVLKPALSINELQASDWKRLLAQQPAFHQDNPFVQYEFLKTLEDTGSVSSESGWQPCHLTFYRNDELVAVLPNFIKMHSYGEYVFDWAWADAYQRNGLDYYPKSLTAVPMTPITGPRLLSSLPESDSDALMRAATQWVEQNQLSSWHINFLTHEASQDLNDGTFLQRKDIQFHWHNHDYVDFDDFLSSLKAKKRKNIRRERKPFHVEGSDWSFEWLDGVTATHDDWALFDQMYRNTFDKKGGWAQLSEDCFESIAKAMPEQTLLLLAKHKGQPVAGAFFMRSSKALYGRYWGCFEDVEFLHFETCYYQGIDYAIKHGLALFEPGAQGEHKLARGFTPTYTHSLHHVAHPKFREAIAHAIEQEHTWLDIRLQEYLKHSPYSES